MTIAYPFYRPLLVLAWLALPLAASASGPQADTLLFWRILVEQTETALSHLHAEHARERAPLRNRWLELDAALARPEAALPEQGYPLLLQKIRLEADLQALDAQAEVKVLRLRYQKAVEVLRILYEKILGMDHHFTSLRTNQQVLRLSNPHDYPDFKEMRIVLDERMKRKYNFGMPAILQANPYLSAAYTLLGLTLGGSDSKLDQAQLQKLSCILDFTVRMHQDLNVVCYETEYLRDANLTLKRECETLFADAARQVGYAIPLTVCRDTDDWERLYGLLDHYANRMAATPDVNTQRKMQANLQFAVDRVVHFIEKYCAFVSQGGEYYRKFSRIVGSYQNEKNCSGALPETFGQLKSDIEITLEKFNSAYHLPEIQGSRLKDLLYGSGD